MRLTGKSLFDVNDLARRSLHETTASALCPLQTFSSADLSLTLKIALVSSNHDGRPTLSLLLSVLPLHVDQLGEEVEVLQGLGVCDVVDEEESVGGQVRGGPHATVFFLAGRVGEEERVGLAVDGAGDRVRVFDCGIVVVGPGRADDAQCD
jgi:hypothetical protein